MHPRVRQLYKELIFSASTYGVLPLAVSRERIKTAFAKHKNLEVESDEWKRALAWGRHELKNFRVMHEVKQFRAMRKYDATEESSFPTPFSSLTAPTGGGGSSKRGPRANDSNNSK